MILSLNIIVNHEKDLRDSAKKAREDTVQCFVFLTR